MSPQQIAEIVARLERLERASVKPRGRTNQNGAARYLGISTEGLRQRHARGEGPPRARYGRYWSYSYDDLDRYLEEQSST